MTLKGLVVISFTELEQTIVAKIFLRWQKQVFWNLVGVTAMFWNCWSAVCFWEGMRWHCYLAHLGSPSVAARNSHIFNQAKYGMGWNPAVKRHLLRRRFARFAIWFVKTHQEQDCNSEIAGTIVDYICLLFTHIPCKAKNCFTAGHIRFLKFTPSSFARPSTFGGSRSNSLLKKRRSRKIKKSRKKRSRRWKETSFITAKWLM